ncbi:MAG: ribbon-helix-helix protein, CopG family, partial [Thermoplasmatales archaeon]|nr:ribbon-helix-helix protein, CopG family [Thermoplasmatales archaeon]
MTKYYGVSLPKDLLERVGKAIVNQGYSNKTDFIRQAIRNELRRIEL